jgi:hypothetical protein
MKDQIGWFIAAIVYLAILFTLVRPHSKGAAIVGYMFTTFTDLVRGVSGQTYNTTTKTWSTGS